MKKILIFYCLTFLLLLQACSQQQKIERGIVYNDFTLKNDTSLSYAIYVPVNSERKDSLVFIFFDPHGNGELPVNMYKNLADKYGITLIGNNNSANGIDFNTISSNFSALLNELKSSYSIAEKNIALWGFSGGSKAAIYNTSLNNNIAYCIYGGSVMNVQNKNTELLGFNGKQDMNYTDLLTFASQQQNNPKHFQIAFNGKHAWPDTTTAEDAFRWLILKKMQKIEIPANKIFAAKCFAYYKKKTDKLIQSNQLTDAYQTCNKSIHFLQTLTATNYFTKQKDSISGKPLFKKQAQELQATFVKESQLKTQYQTNFFSKDTLYWKKEIEQLWTSGKTDPTGIYNRLLGFLSLAGYSYANQAFQSNDIKALEQILFIYQHSDPANPEQAYMRAKLYVLKNDKEKAKTALEESIKMGIDKNRITNDILLKNL
ncbi:MAG: hypothetical protein IPP60_15185 [Sphingobacteriales bacterium]|nr:hypothetical protein [Sphingobacteriales bacterium]